MYILIVFMLVLLAPAPKLLECVWLKCLNVKRVWLKCLNVFGLNA